MGEYNDYNPDMTSGAYADVLDRIELTTNEQGLNVAEREMMTKASRIFDHPDRCRHCLPDMEEGELIKERTSFLRGSDDDGNTFFLTYARLYSTEGDKEVLDLSSQRMTYSEVYMDVPREMTLPNIFPDAEMDDELFMRMERLVDSHLVELPSENHGHG